MKEILRYKNILISIAIIVIFIFVIKGLWTKHSSVMGELKKKMSDLEKNELLLEDWRKANLEYSTVQKKFSIKNQLFFKKFLEEQTKSFGINVTYLSPSRKQEEFYSEMSFNIKASFESFPTIVKFLKALEEKNVVIEKLSLRHSGGTDGKKKSADITVKSFLLEQ